MRDAGFKPFLVCVMLTAAIHSAAVANITVSGQILIAPGDGGANYIASVNVSQADNQGNGTTTDNSGRFTLTVPSASTNLRITGTQIVPQTVSAAQFQNGGTYTVPESSIKLDEVVVSEVKGGGDGCDLESNDRITAELALCNVHAYNIGLSKNPESGADKQAMKEVIALKTTVITQQMNKQYEYMEAMIQRLKTQLQKAVLTTKLQAAGAVPATSGGRSGGGSSSDGGVVGGSSGGRPNRGLANAEDCANSYTTSAEVMSCLLRNVAKIQSAVSSGDLGTARRQLEQDLAALAPYNDMVNNESCKTATRQEDAKNKDCENAVKNGSKRDTISSCLGALRACIIKNTEALQKSDKQRQSWN